jgi:hypothetical protein
MGDSIPTADPLPETEAAGAAAPRRRRRWPWIVLLLLVLAVVGLRAALPLAVERGAAFGSRYWLGLPARVENADFDLVGGWVVLEGVTVGAEPDAVAPRDAALAPPALDEGSALLHFDRVAAHLSWQDLREGRIRLTELALDAPLVRVQREADGAIDPLRHAVPLAPPAEASTVEPTEAPPSEPWPVAVDRFALSAPNVVIVDPVRGENLLEFSLETFALERVSAKGSEFALGGVEIEGPKLRVRRDLVLAAPVAPKAPAAPEAPVVAPEAPPVTAEAPVVAAEAPPVVAETPPVAAETPPVAAEAPSEAPPPSAKPAPAGYRVEKIDIARATFTWVTDQGPLDVAMALHAADLTADEGRTFPFDLQLEIASGRIAIAGDVGILPPSYQGKMTWSGLPFPPLLLASLPDLAAWLRSADSEGDLVLDVDVAGARGEPRIRMSGRTAIAALAIADPGQKEVAVGWKQLEVVMKDVQVPLPQEGKPLRTTVANLELVKLLEPTIRYSHPSPALNALLGIRTSPPQAGKETDAAKTAKPARGEAAPTVQAKSEASPAKPAPAGASPVDVTIASLELVAGDLQVIDTTVKPPVTSFLKALNVSASDLHIPDPSARAVKLRATLPKDSALAIDGDLRPGNNGDFTVSLQKLDLPVFSPYAAAAGASLDTGQASVKTKLKLRGATMQVDNDLVLRKFGVSLRDPSSFDRQFGMPIDLALALLRDPSGDIKLRIPVKIGEKGAEVSMGAVIASALKAALLGAVTAPLKMLGAAFGGDEGGGMLGGGGLFGIAPVPVEPGLADLAAAADSRAVDLAKLLASRPAMGLTLKGRTGPAERPVIAEQVLVEGLKGGKGLPDLEGAGFLARRRIGQALVARDKAGGAKGAAPEDLSAEDGALYARYLEAAEVTPARLDGLCRARAEKFRDLLVAKGVDATRLTVGERELDGAPGVVVSFRAR